VSAPRVSVVIPAYRSAGTIARTLAALRKQSFRDFETIVVNSSPDEETAAIVAAELPGARFEQAPRRLLPHAARNRGVELASGGLLVFTDPDCEAREDWLERLVAAHDAGHRAVVGAMGLATDSAFERGVHLCKYSSWLRGGAEGPRSFAPTANALLARAAWEAVGPFDGEVFAGDVALGHRLAAGGEPAWFEPRAVVDHVHGGTVRTFVRERYERGEDFGRTRPAVEGWSRKRVAAQLAALPLLPPLLAGRAFRDARRAGWRVSPLTLAHVVLAQSAWCLGEARAHLRLMSH
jgi:glycosyltransferase involved in cell wall biosynthesis